MPTLASKRNADGTLVNGKRNAERNADSLPANDQRNAGRRAMTSAERQRRYRDKKRGGPPLGRWHGHATAQQLAPPHLGRTSVFMGRWIIKHAPDLCDHQTGQIDFGEYRTLTACYRGLKKERMRAAKAFFDKTDGDAMLALGYTLVESRSGHCFVFQWVKGTEQE